jgi:TonB family protein
LVVDFPNQRGMTNILGARISECLSDALAARLGPEHLIAPEQFRAGLLSQGISPFDMQEDDVALWNAQKAGANLGVLGHLQSSAAQNTLTVRLIRTSDNKEIAHASTNLSLTEETQSLADKASSWLFDAGVLVSCLATARDAVVALFKNAGVSEPKCIHCPVAPYTDEARKARQQGDVKFDVIIDEQGRVSTATVTKGSDYGLANQAMATIKDWSFVPATKDGRPVKICSQVVMTLRIF